MAAKVFLTTLLVLTAAALSASAQQHSGEPVLSVFRQQAASISEELLGALGPAFPPRVRLSVEGGDLPAVLEYAVLETFSGRGIAVSGAEASVDYRNHLTILVLEQRARYDSLSPAGYLRTVRTVLEGRFSAGEGESVRYLGSYERTTGDTVESREPLPWIQPDADRIDEPSVFSKIVAPVVVITGAVLIVYLFFAVRSS